MHCLPCLARRSCLCGSANQVGEKVVLHLRTGQRAYNCSCANITKHCMFSKPTAKLSQNSGRDLQTCMDKNTSNSQKPIYRSEVRKVRPSVIKRGYKAHNHIMPMSCKAKTPDLRPSMSISSSFKGKMQFPTRAKGKVLCITFFFCSPSLSSP